MQNFKELNQQIPLPDAAALQQARAHWDGIAKPLNGLGHLEDAVVKIAALTGEPQVRLDKRAVVVLCADNGVVAEGVTQTESCVTATMAGQIRDHRSSVCLMASCAKADVFAVDMGMTVHVDGVDGCHIADGTKNIAREPAMTKKQACQAIAYGMNLVKQYRDMGYQILVTGEMGIGNTTTSSALASVLLDLPVETVTGRGAGLSDAGLARKCDAIHRAISLNQPDPSDALDVLSKLGGFDIAGMVGIFLGGALYRLPILIDGLISSVSALIAARLCPVSRCAMLASHTSAEPAATKILEELGLTAILHAGMKLGEGTGAVCMLPLLDMALSVYHGSAAFSDAGIDQYTPPGGHAMMVLLTGGSGCGKSSYAESLCMNLPAPRYYIAAMKPYGEDSQAKIDRHRQMRKGKGFETFERYTDLAGLSLPEKGTVLLECICNLTANEMFDDQGNMTDPVQTVLSAVENLKNQADTLIVVTNDVGSDSFNYDPGTKAYIRALGEINAVLAQNADTVYELVCGIPIVLKGELPE